MSIAAHPTHRRTLLIAAVLALSAGYAVTAVVTDAPPASAATGPLVWADDFDGPAGTAPDAGRWVHDTGGSGFGNNELEYYTTSTANAAPCASASSR